MTRRKNVKRIDPRYFLHETVNRGEELEEDKSKRREPYVDPMEEPELEEGCPHAEEGGEAIDISAPGMEVHVDDISQLSPEEAFAAGMAAARDAIDQVMGAPDGPPPEGGFSGSGPMAEPAMQETIDEEGTEELKPFQHKKGPMAAKRRWAIERARKLKAGEPLGKHAGKWGVPHKNEPPVRKGEE